jgi:hypothetical protein
VHQHHPGNPEQQANHDDFKQKATQAGRVGSSAHLRELAQLRYRGESGLPFGGDS